MGLTLGGRSLELVAAQRRACRAPLTGGELYETYIVAPWRCAHSDSEHPCTWWAPRKRGEGGQGWVARRTSELME